MLEKLEIGQKLELSDKLFILRTKDGYLNECGDLVQQRPGAMKPVIERDFFTKEIHEEIISFVKSQGFLYYYDNQFNRIAAHNVPYFKHIHNQLAETASEIFQEKVKPSYSFLSLYDKNGICRFHIDRPQCKYTIDYCIDQDKEWPIWVDNQSYLLKPNDAVCYSGTDSPHFREKITGDYCWLVFFHFVPVEFSDSLE